jgi:uncharacterized protein DUF2252
VSEFRQATASYETWLRECTPVVESALRSKHRQMKSDPLLFLRGSYYRWTQLFPVECEKWTHVPTVLASGDLHLGSFGTWRDQEGRLCWGVDDFDDAYPLPFTNDLIRLATSLRLVAKSELLEVDFTEGCDAILEGYQKSLKEGGCPFVLAERKKNMERLGIEAIKPAKDFWDKLLACPGANFHEVPLAARAAIDDSLPPRAKYKIVRREAGVGSLGQPRFVAIASHAGGYIAREIKFTVPSASVWNRGKTGRGERYYDRLIRSAVRSHDPYQKTSKGWLVRRLSPDSNPVDIEDLPSKRDELTLLSAMGKEIGNVHLGSKGRVKAILKNLRHQKSNWLTKAGKRMAKIISKEWKDYAKTD